MRPGGKADARIGIMMHGNGGPAVDWNPSRGAVLQESLWCGCHDSLIEKASRREGRPSGEIPRKAKGSFTTVGGTWEELV